MTHSVYVETTIVSYLAARPSRDLLVAARQQITHDWWAVGAKRFDLFVSELVVREATAGDPEAARRRLGFMEGLPALDLTEQAFQLAQHLIESAALPSVAAEDALHIAVATANGMDFLLTWNFRHIANALTRRRIGRACLVAGYEAPVICTPEELLEGS